MNHKKGQHPLTWYLYNPQASGNIFDWILKRTEEARAQIALLPMPLDRAKDPGRRI